MAVVNKFNVNKQEVTLDSDIIENMSANDVPYDSSFQYDENTVGDKLSELSQQVIYDVSAHNNGTVFESLSDLLSRSNLSTLIPTSVRHGGMSIRFIQGSLQGSDNKYVQYRLMSDEFTIDTTQWAVADECYMENPEYLAVWLDAEDKVVFGLKTDGKTYVADADFIDNIKDNQDAIEEIKSTFDIDTLSSITVTESPEYIEATTDSEDKIISYRDSNGVIHEEVGIDVCKATVKSLIAQDITFKNDDANNAFAKSLIYRSDSIKKYDLPDNGSINILSETFYLTKHEGYTDKNGIYPIQEYENNLENAEAKRICRVYYVKSTLRDNGDGTYSKIEGSVPLTLYVPKQILVVNDIPYVKDTLTEVSDGVYEVNEDSIAVTKITALPDFQTWAINKDDEHQCKVAIDFGNYLSGEFFIGIKFQGASTLNRPKRNLRFTFYKKSDYNKKLKVKIGEFVRLSGFNLKAFWGDSTKLKEASLNRIMMAIWEKRPDINKTYPWIKDYGFYTGATGMIKSFPSMVSIGGEYYGFYIFGLKKDEKNYMLDGDDDASGIFASCDGMSWKEATARKFSDEMGVKSRELAYPDMGDDSLSVESAKALNVFLSFAANTLCTGSDGLSYGKSDLTFYVGKMDYTYDKVTTTDDSNGFVLIANNDTKITTIYVTDSLQTKNLLANRTDERAYRGTDGNLYIISELTLITGEYFVTKSLQQENHIKAVELSENIYNVDIDSGIFRFISSELTKIGNSYYHIYYYPDEHSISATYEPFSQSEAPKHMDVLGFIDYFIGLQVFYMPDNVRHNLILYAGADKKLFYPFFYDMDLTFPNYNEITSDVLDAYSGNTDVNLIWYLLIREYADVIYNRYIELKKSILNMDYINDIFYSLRRNIPEDWANAEKYLWGATFKYDDMLYYLKQRFDWLDKYFLNLIK